MIDTHAHLTDTRFENIEEVINNAFNNGIKFIINNTSNIKDSFKSLELAEKYKNIYSTFGVHPLDVETIEADFEEIIIQNISHPKVVAIGEIGLDYHYSEETKDKQKEILKSQCFIAEKYNKPVVIHAREAVRDTINILKNFNLKGVFHCYSGSVEELKEILEMGYFIGFDGPITFKKNQEYIEILKNTPLERILCETDSPYLAPVPFRGKTNEPSLVKYIYEKISEIKEIDITTLRKTVHSNALELFVI